MATRVAEFDFGGVAHLQSESFFAVRVERFTPQVDGWDELERDALLELRWWTVAELAASTERIYPSGLADVVQAIIDDRIDTPIELSSA